MPWSTPGTQQLEWAVHGLAIVAALVGLVLLATGEIVTGGLGVVGAVMLWQEVRHG